MIKKICIRENKHFHNINLDLTNKDGKPYSKVYFIGNNGCLKTKLIKSILWHAINDKGNNSKINLKFREETRNDPLLQDIRSYIAIEHEENSSPNIHAIFVDCKFEPLLPHKNAEKVSDPYIENDYNNLFSENARTTNDGIRRANNEEYNFSNYILYRLYDDVLLKVLKDGFQLKNECTLSPNKNEIHSNFHIVINSISNFISYITIDPKNPIDNTHDLVFSSIRSAKTDKKLNITQLSSGETQVIGLHSKIAEPLINGDDNNMEVIYGFDEPETNLHPQWQQNIIGSLDNLSNKLKIQHQYFIATHSSYILKNALSSLDKSKMFAIICDKDKKLNIIPIEKNEEFKLDNPTLCEIDFVIFHIPTPEYFIMLYEKIRFICSATGIPYKDFDKDYLCNIYHLPQSINLDPSSPSASKQTEVTRLRHLLAHGFKQETAYKNFIVNKNNYDQTTKDFYDRYENKYDELLENCITTLRNILDGIN